MTKRFFCTTSILTVFGLISFCAIGEDKSSALDWLASKEIEIRKNFNGTATDIVSPASLTYYNVDDGEDYRAIDFAIKLKSWNALDNDTVALRIYPVFEHHRNTNTKSGLKKSSATLGAELDYELGKKRSLFFDTNATISRDSINDRTTQGISIFGFIESENDWEPGNYVSAFDGLFEFKYRPQLGLQHYRNLAIVAKVDGETEVIADSLKENFVALKFGLEVQPLPDYFGGNLVIVYNLTYRSLIGSSDFAPDMSDFAELSFDYYLDTKKRVAIGFSWSNGENPARNFLKERQSSLGLKIKF